MDPGFQPEPDPSRQPVTRPIAFAWNFHVGESFRLQPHRRIISVSRSVFNARTIPIIVARCDGLLATALFDINSAQNLSDVVPFYKQEMAQPQPQSQVFIDVWFSLPSDGIPMNCKLWSMDTNAEISRKMGVNYGQLGNNLPSPSRSIELIKSLKAGHVKHANPYIMKALEGTNIQVSIMVPNQLISNISSSQSPANEWVRTNVVPFYSKTLIHYLLVGNEIFNFSSDQDRQTWYDLVQAMCRLKYSLKIHNIRNIKIGTTTSMDVLQSSFSLSNGTFRSDISISVMKPLLQFLN
uniref:(1->3)-beta-glucan endohydrolase n=1 Tax=Nelumbo nucifera TaxID=4432 RepID=A0A822XRJ5_NELNU|nr:TPA_asm: hypothetical protein HUJ06_022858 [Nelumbo nucifera]